MSEAMIAVGRPDCDDDAEIAAVARQVRELVALSRAHLDKEERFLYPAL